MLNRRLNLVVVRAGDCSHHPGWMGIDDNWDLIVSYFGESPTLYQSTGTRIDGKGPKWPAIHSLLSRHPSLLSDYEFILFPDDDLEIEQGVVNSLFDACRSFILKLSQPSLSQDSFVAHAVTIQNPATRVRYTNYVELMAPCFSSAALAACWATFNENISGWGLDILWPTLLGAVPGRIGIVDAVTVRHTRPFNGPNYLHNANAGVSPSNEMLALLAKYEISRTSISVDAAVNQSGRELSAAKLMEIGTLHPTAPWLI